MNREKVISREYKLVLKAENFTGAEKNLVKKTHTFWTNCRKIIKPVTGVITGDLNKISAQREIRFYDTANLTMHGMDYIFRERKNLLKDEKEVTLKFRHPDRYISQDRDMLSRKIGKGETKFEEDIKAPFLKLYSFSSTQPVEDDQAFTKLKHIVKLYPGLKSQLTSGIEEEKIFLVNELAVREVVITGTEIIIGDDPAGKAECALIVWYDSKVFGIDPLIVEFSFRYGNKKEKYSTETAKKAYDLFILIQKGMESWIDAKNPTKTGFIYDK
jgi:hypothetical protein